MFIISHIHSYGDSQKTLCATTTDAIEKVLTAASVTGRKMILSISLYLLLFSVTKLRVVVYKCEFYFVSNFKRYVSFRFISFHFCFKPG